MLPALFPFKAIPIFSFPAKPVPVKVRLVPGAVIIGLG